jgi:hypothetical protein
MKQRNMMMGQNKRGNDDDLKQHRFFSSFSCLYPLAPFHKIQARNAGIMIISPWARSGLQDPLTADAFLKAHVPHPTAKTPPAADKHSEKERKVQ